MKISADKLPKAALKKMSAAQRSYIDEFTFYRAGGHIDAVYAGEYLATWDGKGWKTVSGRWGASYGPQGGHLPAGKTKASAKFGRDPVPSPKRDRDIERQMELGFLEAIWLDSYMSWAEENNLSYTSGHIPQHVRDLDDIPQAPPLSAKKLARKYGAILVKMNKANLTQLYDRASHAEGSSVNPKILGFYLAMQSAGHGVSWTDSHARFNVTLPSAEWYAYGKKGRVGLEGYVSERFAGKL